MSLSPEFEEFYRSWIQKVDNYSTDNIRDCFDKFFTLFVIYNRLYAEATFVLARRNYINISKRTSFPDSSAAKNYVLQYLTSNYLIKHLEDNRETLKAIHKIRELINGESFYIKLDMVTGAGQRDRDLELLKSLHSKSTHKKAEAILDFLYSIRCNMFHGHKEFQQIQMNLLKPTIIILKKVIAVLYNKLLQDHS